MNSCTWKHLPRLTKKVKGLVRQTIWNVKVIWCNAKHGKIHYLTRILSGRGDAINNSHSSTWKFHSRKNLIYNPQREKQPLIPSQPYLHPEKKNLDLFCFFKYCQGFFCKFIQLPRWNTFVIKLLYVHSAYFQSHVNHKRKIINHLLAPSKIQRQLTFPPHRSYLERGKVWDINYGKNKNFLRLL
jgi:hypothetical protein